MMRTLLCFIVFVLLLSFVQKSDYPVLHFVGDSTMADKLNEPSHPERGWAQMFRTYLKEGVNVRNHAMNGRSTRNFQTEGRWAKVLDELAPGDYVLIQFGHNDSKVDDPNRFAEADTDYRANLHLFVSDVRAKGAIPILITPIARRSFDGQGIPIDKHGQYPHVVREVAAKDQVILIDLQQRTTESLTVWGPEASKQLFMHFPAGLYDKFPDGIEDNTHLSPTGASWICDLFIKEMKIHLPHLLPILRN